MNATELDSFVLKFKHIWRSGFDAHLDLECHAGQAWVGIRVRLGHEHGLQSPGILPSTRNKNSPSRLRRRARRAAARQEEETQHAGEASEDNDVAAENAVSTLDVANIAEKAMKDVQTRVKNEVCARNKEEKKCTVQLYPESSCNIETFCISVENYFSKKNDKIDRVIACEVSKYGTYVRLECVIRRQVWINYFSEPKEQYGDLLGVKMAVHDCKDLVNCDQVLLA